MALVLKDRVRETTTTTGTGTVTLAGAVTGFQTFSSAIGNTNTTYYTIAGQGTSEWEVGLGTVGAGTLSRDTVLASSNANALVVFSAGTKDVFCDYPAGKAVYDDASGNAVNAVYSVNAITLGTTGTDLSSSVANSTTSPTITLNVPTASATNRGALSSTDWTTFNNKWTSGTALSATTGSFSGQITSTVATGTSPFNLSSSSLNTNLNADYLDGQHGSYYQPASTAITTSNIGSQSVSYATTAGNGGQFFGTAATKAIAYNSNTIGENITVTAGNNGLSAGPITISTGFTVTVATGAVWVIV